MSKRVTKRKRKCSEEEDESVGKKIIVLRKQLADLEAAQVQQDGSKSGRRQRGHGEVAISSKQGHEDVVKSAKRGHDDVAKSQHCFESEGPRLPVRQRHDDVAKSQHCFESDGPRLTASSSRRHGTQEESEEDNTSLANLLRRDQGHRGQDSVAPSIVSNRREDDANTSQFGEEGIFSDQASLVIGDQSSESDSDISLDQDVLSLFGKNVVQSSNLSPPIQKDLSAIWAGIINKGLGEEERQELVRKFPHPENCISLAPPKLNPLVISASSDQVIRRDKRLFDIQAQISAAISAVGLSVTSLLKRKGERDVGAIQQLGEAGRLLTDLFYQETLSRRELAALNLNKSLKDTLLNAPNDEWLFGKDLEDRVRSHKNLAQSSKDLKDEKLPPTRASSSLYPKRPLNSKSSPRKIQGPRRGGRQQYQQPRQAYKAREGRDKWFRKPERQGQRSRYHQ
jgi:hypothetical protein